MIKYVIREHSKINGTYYVSHGHVVVYDVLDARFFNTVEEAQKFVGSVESVTAEIIKVEIAIDIKEPVIRIEPEMEYE